VRKLELTKPHCKHYSLEVKEHLKCGYFLSWSFNNAVSYQDTVVMKTPNFMMWHGHNTLLLSMTSEIEKLDERMLDE
jgi:hypothetical protein